jgi:hypothetical protein
MAPSSESLTMSDEDEVITGPTVTKLGPQHVGAVMVAGSHAGVMAAYLAAKGGLRAVVFNDAGRGLDDSGIGGLRYLQALGIPAAAVDCMTARIGDGADMHARGIISHANALAAALGVARGMRCAEAARLLLAAPVKRCTPPDVGETRYVLRERAGEPAVWGVDSASLVRPEDDGRILMVGSHGALLGGDPAAALRCDALAAVFNDAGVGIDGAGVTRLPALAARGMPAAAVDWRSARISDARSCWNTGVLSHVNEVAAALGARPGLTAQVFADLVAARAGARP